MESRSEPVSADVDAARELALAMEALGEAMQGCDALDPAISRLAAALAEGRSVVPLDEEGPGFAERVRSAVARVGAPVRRGDGARSLRAWLGGAVASWVGERLDAVPCEIVYLGLCGAVDDAVAARGALRGRHEETARAFSQWHAAGLDASAGEVFAAASALALDEAIDRWTGLGFTSDLHRYVVTWQRASAGWAERVLGRATEVDAGDLGRLSTLRVIAEELRLRRVPKRRFRAVLAARMALLESDIDRLLGLDAQVRERRAPKAVVSRRWSLIKPVADVAGRLGQRLGRSPTADEIAAEAGVARALVELIVDALQESESD